MYHTSPLTQETELPTLVLLVARDPEVEDACRQTLSDAGITSVMSTNDADEAAVLLSNRQLFDAIVIGVGPGDSDVADLAQRLRRNHSGAPVLILSPVSNLELLGFERHRGSALELHETIFDSVRRLRSARAC